MTDYVLVYIGPQDVQIDTGKGHLAGVMVTSGVVASGTITVYDYAGAGPPTGPKIYEAVINMAYPLITLFNDRYAPRFHDGGWLHLSDDLYATIWIHFPRSP